MLVLSRKWGEKIVIGCGSVIIEVIAYSRGEVQLGITAPKHITIDREEVFKRKHQPLLHVSNMMQKFPNARAADIR